MSIGYFYEGIVRKILKKSREKERNKAILRRASIFCIILALDYSRPLVTGD
jgi:hypothetical protein